MKRNLSIGTLLLLTSLMILAVSCEKEVKNEPASSPLQSISSKASPAGKSVATETKAAMLKTELLKDLRNATARYHSTTQAIKAGYVPDDHCVNRMGYHWANFDLVDPVFDPLQPEVVLYAKGPGGNLRLVAVEYIVINNGQPRPMFGDQPFDIGGTPVPAPHWSLHVWLYEPNPNGMFTPFNPNITCP